jgi:tetratricopeptide (TPR) repeat protein
MLKKSIILLLKVISMTSNIVNQVNAKEIKKLNIYSLDKPSLNLETRKRNYQEGTARTYYFGSTLLGFYGRGKEKEDLEKFITLPDKLRLWIITGIGGTGKSKLAFEICNQYRKEGYYAGFLDKGAKQLSTDWSPENPTIIIIDYAAERIEQIKQFISMYESSQRWKHRVRIILIERDEIFLKEKLNELSPTENETYNCMLYKPQSLHIEPLGNAEILQIMRYILQDNPTIKQTYTDKELLELFKKIDGKKRTIFAIYLAETLRDSAYKSKSSSNIDSILASIYKKEVDRWKTILQNKDDYQKYMHLIYLTTLMGGCDKSILNNSEIQNVLPEKNEYSPYIYAQLIGGTISGEKISQLEPDIFGEYALLCIEEDIKRNSLGEQHNRDLLYSLAWSHKETNIYDVLYRMLRDFPDDERATQFFNKCIEKANIANPEIKQKVAFAYHNKGFALGELKRYEEELEACEKAIELDPDYALAYHNKGVALVGLKRYEEELEACEKAIELDPDLALAYYNKGFALGELKRYEEELEACEKAIELDPDLALAYNSKGSALINLNRPEEALEVLEKAIELDPNDAMAYNNKGVALQKLGKNKDADKAFKKAEELRLK